MPDIKPEVFWKTALATGDPVTVEGDKRTYPGKRVDPARLIEALRDGPVTQWGRTTANQIISTK